MPPARPLDPRLYAAFVDCDAATTRRLLDEAVRRWGVDSMIVDSIVPAVWELERMWAQGRFSVTHEYRVSALLREVTAPYRPLDSPRPLRPFVMASVPGEMHDIRQHLFAVLLQQRGLATMSLGRSVPWRMLADTVRTRKASGCALYVSDARLLGGRTPIVQHLATLTRAYIAGPATTHTHILGAASLPLGWRDAADLVAFECAPQPDIPSREGRPT